MVLLHDEFLHVLVFFRKLLLQLHQQLIVLVLLLLVYLIHHQVFLQLLKHVSLLHLRLKRVSHFLHLMYLVFIVAGDRAHHVFGIVL